MACTGCMKKFSYFNREHGCSNCAFGFCDTCLCRKFVIEKYSPLPSTVCLPCYEKLAGVAPAKSSNLKQRNEAEATMNDKKWWGDDVLPPPSFRQQYEKDDKHKYINKALSKADSKKLECDAQLREMEERLARLKGVDVELIRKPRLFITNDGYDESDNEDVNAEEVLKELQQDEMKRKAEREKNGSNISEVSSVSMNHEIHKFEDTFNDSLKEARKAYKMANDEIKKSIEKEIEEEDRKRNEKKNESKQNVKHDPKKSDANQVAKKSDAKQDSKKSDAKQDSKKSDADIPLTLASQEEAPRKKSFMSYFFKNNKNN
uniref:FYVE-type domain-containing protein n=1 Tax=Rhabditophanes sp. KR3021 TaxID=114890 RepID=A0AC35UDT8_9BILA